MREVIRKNRIMIADLDNDSGKKLGWRFFLNNKEFVDMSDELIIKLNGQKKGEEIIANLEKDLIHQFNLN